MVKTAIQLFGGGFTCGLSVLLGLLKLRINIGSKDK